jgi:type IV secretion system protein VirD4
MKQVRDNRVGPQVKEKKKTYHWGYACAVAVALLVSLGAATQHFAHKYKYHQALGGNLEGVYFPWQIITWAQRWYDSRAHDVMASGSVGIITMLVLMLVIFLYKNLNSNSAVANEFMHGSARWATRKDIEEAGLFSTDPFYSVVIGAWQDSSGTIHYLKHSGSEHVKCTAPTRSGKGVCQVVPTLLTWQGSMIINDLKEELYQLTAGWRKKHANNKVLKFNPASATDSIKWNPLDEIRMGTDSEVADVQTIAQMIVDPKGEGLETHWQKTSFSLLTGAIIHLKYKAKIEGGEVSLPALDRLLSDPERPVEDLYVEMATYKHLGDRPHETAARSGRDMLDTEDRERSSILSTAKSYLSLYRDPVVANNVSSSEFKIKQLMHYESPVSLYIVTKPVDKDRLKPLVRLLITMSIRILADDLSFEDGRPKASYKYRLCWMADELPALGKLEILQESLAFLAGYGLKFYIIIQDMGQLQSEKAGYGKDETISANCHIQPAFAPLKNDTAKYLSDRTGGTTIVKKQITVSGKRTAFVQGNSSTTFSETARPLMTADEVMRMPGPKKDGETMLEGGDMLITVAGYPAIYGKQMPYFLDPIYSARAKVPAPAKTDKLIESVGQVVL